MPVGWTCTWTLPAPYAESDGLGYVRTDTRKLLRVLMLEPCKSLRRGDAMTCMLRSLNYDSGGVVARLGPGV